MAQDRLIWFKGKILPADQAMVSVLSPTSQFGLNVFEGIRGYWNEDSQNIYLFRLKEHLDRLMESCKLIGITSPYSTQDIAQYIKDTIVENAYQEDVALRVTLFVDQEGSWANSEPVEMFIAPISKRRRDVLDGKGASACISSWRRIDDQSFPPRVKAGANYINGRYAHLEAKRNGYDLPIFLDHQGKVSEGAGSCLFIFRNERLVTPTVTHSILESITRESLLAIANSMGIDVQERAVDRTELYLASDLFLCGSAAEITPVTSLDNITIGSGKTSAKMAQLYAEFMKVISEPDHYEPRWKTAVYQSSGN